MKRIKLTQGQYTIVDDEHYDYLMQWKWWAHWFPQMQQFYAERGKHIDGKLKTFSMHRVLMGEPKGQDVDHKNGNCLDNRIENLRVCSHSENGHNRGLSTRNTSGFMGVSFEKRGWRIRWRARIRIDGRLISLGRFRTPQEAAHARDKAALEYRGGFARLNFPKGA
jgi:HNH endonuclease/AP2 domain